MLRCHGFQMSLTAAIMFVLGCASAEHEAQERAAPDAGGSSAPAPDPHARKLATSASHSCALRASGVYCWGANEAGQLGDRTTTSSQTPVQAQVEASDIVELAVHTGRSCARRSTGRVACWGTNESGQLGDGMRSASPAPVEPALDDAAQLALSETTGCALRTDGSVSCWGGSPDDASDEGSLTPVDVAGVGEALELVGGPMNTYCVRGETFTRCFQLNGGAWSDPIELPDLAAASSIALASAQEVCGIVSGEVVCTEVTGGSRAQLNGSRGTIQLAGGLLTLCGGDIVGTWYCWNILSPMVLAAIGAPRTELSRGPFDELATAGFRYCGLAPSGAVSCLERNTASPAWSDVADLPE